MHVEPQVFEVLTYLATHHDRVVTTEELIEAINREMDSAELKKIAMRNGMKTLHQDSLLKVKEGLSTMEEAIATVPPDL